MISMVIDAREAYQEAVVLSPFSFADWHTLVSIAGQLGDQTLEEKTTEAVLNVIEELCDSDADESLSTHLRDHADLQWLHPNLRFWQLIGQEPPTTTSLEPRIS